MVTYNLIQHTTSSSDESTFDVDVTVTNSNFYQATRLVRNWDETLSKNTFRRYEDNAL